MDRSLFEFACSNSTTQQRETAAQWENFEVMDPIPNTMRKIKQRKKELEINYKTVMRP